MKGKPNHTPDQEPIGIVISRGSRSEQAPTVFAYVWGPAPEIERRTHASRRSRSITRGIRSNQRRRIGGAASLRAPRA